MRILKSTFLAFALIVFIYLPGFAQLTESLYVNSSTSSMPINSPSNCLGAPDGLEASIDSNLANYENWTFNFDDTAYPESTLISAQLFMTHRQIGYQNDSLIMEYFYGADSVEFENFANIPATLTTVGPYNMDSLLTTSRVDSFRVRMRGVIHTEPPEHIDYFVDAMELRLTYEINEPPVIASIPAQNLSEGGHLEVRISATDPDPGDVITLSAVNLPANASFVDSTGGIGGLTFDPDYSQAGPHQVMIIATDVGGFADTQLVDIAVANVDLAPILDPITPPTLAEGEHLDLRVTASDPDGDAVSLTAEFTSANMAFADSSGGVGGLTFDPDFTQAGVHQVRFIAASNLLADTQLVDITVNNVDLPPAIDPITPPTLAEGEHLDLRVTASDPDGDAITLVAEFSSANMTFADSSGGVGGLAFDPDFTQSGIHQVRFIATSNLLADTQLVDITVNNVDLPPLIDPITPPTLAEGAHLDLRVTASDPDGDAITLSAELLSSNMAFADSSGGVGGLTFDPDYTQSGVHQVRFIASSNLLADTQLVDITVTDVDLPPVLDPITPPTLAEGEHLDLRVTASDFDGDAITLVAEFSSANMAFADSSGGVGGLTFDPDYTQSGVHQVRFIASSTTFADTQLVDITVTNTDRAPLIDPITPPTLAEGEHLDLRVTASDPDGDAITLVAEFSSANMAFADSSGGVGGLTFDPDFTQSGIHQVRFIASSNLMADTQLVDITVNNVDLPPALDPITPPTLAEGEHLDLRVTASDFDGDVITLVAEFSSANMAFADSSGGVGGLTFDPDYTQSGVHQVRFIASSTTFADTQLVDITVTNVDLPPAIDPITPPTLAEGEHLDLRITASDPDGDAVSLTAEFTSANMAFADSSGGVGGLTFDPDYTQSGIHQVRFIATSNLLADTQLVDITVTNFDLPPAIDPITPPTLAEGEHLDLRVTASDPDGDAITLVAEFSSANMAFADSSGGVGGLTFDPDYTQSGVHQVRLIASSNLLADTQLVDITVNNVDLPPAIDPITPPTLAEGEHLDLRVTASDPDGDAIALSAELLSSNMAFADSSGGVGGLTFDPDYTQSGVHQVRFIATSNLLADTQLVDITVTETDRAPLIDPITPPTLAEGEHLDLRVAASDPDGDAITLVAEFSSANMAFADSSGGVGGLTFDPDYTQSGVHQVRFIATSNSLADTQLVDITVTNFDLPPAIDPITPPTLAEGEHLDLRVTASDPDGDAITLSAELLSTNMAFADSSGGVGGLTFDPDYTQSGLHQVRFIASSNLLADTQLVDITVTNTDRAPLIDPITPPTLAEGEHLDLRVTASDPDGDAITLVAEFSSANMAFADSTGGVGGLTFDPDYTQSGVHQVRFIATSNLLADTQLVDITVTNFDLPPAIDPITPPTLAEGEHLDLRVTASDPDGDAITLVAEFSSANMAFADSSGGVGGLTFDPDFTQSGVHQVRFIASSNLLADTQLVDITVTNVDLPPLIDPITPPTLAEGEHLDLRVTASDPDGDAVSLTAEFTSANMAFSDSSGGVGGLTFDPDYTQSGIHQVRFIATSNLLADTQLVDITVTQTDLPPVIDPVSPQIVDENSHLDVRITASDFDGDPISLSAELLPANAAFVDSSGGVGGLTFDPDYFQSGGYQVRIIASSTVFSDTELVDITVNNVDRSPVLNPIGNRSVLEGNTLTVIITASDPDLETPSLTAENLPVNAVFVDSSNGKGSFEFSPDYTQSGNYNVTFIASDGVLADSETIVVSVLEAGNQAPQVDTIGPQTVVEGEHLEFLVTATDPDSTIPILQGLNLPANAVFADSGNGKGSFTFDPDYNQANIYNVLFRAYDGSLYDSLWVEITVIDSNRAPVLDPIGSRATTEGDTLAFVITASDIDGTTPSLSALNLPLNATFEDSLNGHGLFVFTPDFTQAGIDTVLFIATDGLKSDSEFVQITVSEFGNNPPVLASIGPQSVDEGSLLQLLISATDADSTIPSLSAENMPSGATFTDSLNGYGLFEFTPDYFQSGLYTVRFIASDGTAADTELVDITVNNINRAPVLDSIVTPRTVAEGDSLLFTATASDVDLTVPSLSAVGLPPNATFTDNGDGSADFRFLPDYFQAGPYQILYVASDGDLADSQYVDITVTDVNRAPALDSIPTPQSVPEGDSLLFTATAGDPDLTFPSLLAVGLPANATFFDNGDGSADFRFLPDYFQSGPYQVLFIASDGSLADSQYVDITVTEVNRVPVLDSIPTPQSVNEGDSLLFTATAGDPDLTTPALTAVALPTNATFIDNGDGTGDFRFLPDFNQSGFYPVLFIASDGSLADSQYVDITVTENNLAPVLDSITTPQSVPEGDSVLFTVSASDPDLTIPALTAEGLPANAAFLDNGDGTGNFRFLPDYTQAGPYQILFIASDGSLADSQFVDINVTDVNLAPVLVPIFSPRNVNENDTLTLRITASDPDGNIPSLTAVGLPVNASFVDSANGVGGLIFTPDYTQSGTYPVWFIASDGVLADSQQVVINVIDINAAPVITVVGPQTVNEGDLLQFTVSGTDIDGTVPVLSVFDNPLNSTFTDSLNGTGLFEFGPDYTQSGVYSVGFVASDGTLADTGYVDITVTNINLPVTLDSIPTPQSVDEGDSLLFTVTASDPDGPPSIIAEGLPANATLNDNGDGTADFRFLPDYSQSGGYQILFYATDGLVADSQYVDITVNQINLPPVLDPIGSRSVNEADSLLLTITASDFDGTTPVLSAQDVPANASFADNGNGTGSFRFDPDYFQANIYYVTFIASDGVLADSEVVEITVNDTPRPPVLNPISDRSMFEGQTISFVVSATDPDSTIPILSVDSLPANATFTDSLNGHGLFTFSPGYTQSGIYDLIFIASDGVLADSDQVRITVYETGNQPPVITYIGPQSVVEGQHLEFTVTASDPEGVIPALQSFNRPTNSTFTDFGDGSGLFTFDPGYTQAGVYDVLFRAFDGELYDSLWVQITVIDFGFPPVLDSIGPQSVVEAETLRVVVSASDPDSTIPQLLAQQLPPNATFEDSLNGVGLFTFIPDYTQAGLDTVLFIATDGALSDSEYVEITIVDAGNQPPVLAPIGPQTVDEGSTLFVAVSSSDPDGTTPVLSAENLPAGALFTDSLNGNGLLEFTPDYTQAGLHTVSFIASDGIAADTEVVDITVNNTNLAPVLDTIPSPQTVAEGSLLQLTVTAGDPDSTVLVLSAENLPANATFADSGNGSGLFEFAPDFTQAGPYQVLFIVSDGALADSQYVDIDVTNTDRAPALDPITPPTIAEGDHLDLRVSASDPDGDAITLVAEFASANMAFVDSTGGVGGLIFDPDYTQAGVHQVRFIAQSNALADTQLVDITVTDVDLPPALATIPPQTVAEGGHLDVRVTATDPDGDSIALSAELLPANAAFVDSTGGVGGLTFDPDFTQAGPYQVRLIAASNALADTQLVDITVTESDLPPVLSNIPPQSVNEGGHLEFQVTATDPDGDSIALTAELLVANMTFTDSTGGIGGFTFDPDSSQSGFYQVRFIASSNALADTQLVDITVGNVDLPPSFDPITPPVVAEGDHLDLRVTAVDPDGDSIALTAELLIANMSFADSTGGVGGLTFDPDYTQSGVHQVRFIATSNSLSDTALVDITVLNTNLAPVLDTIPSPQTVAEGGSLQFTVTASDPDGVIPALVALDLPSNASFVDSLNGTGVFTFDPDYDQSGDYPVLFIASDGNLADSQYVDISVTNVNRAPVLDPIISPQTVNENDTLSLRITASDPDGNIPSLVALNIPINSVFADSANGAGGFVFTPDYTQAALYQVTFVASDGSLADSQMVNVIVSNVNAPPVITVVGPQTVTEGESLLFTVSATDVDGTIPILSYFDGPANSSFEDSLNGTGLFSFYPDFTQSGTYNVGFAASDGSKADTGYVNITVLEVGNQAPILSPIGPQIVTEGETLQVIVIAVDPDSSVPLLATGALPPNAAFEDSLNGHGLFTFTPDYVQSGVDTVLFMASDGALADSEYVEITIVEAGNQPPVLDPIGPQSIDEGDSLILTVTSSDPDGTFPALSGEHLPAGAVFVDNGDGTGVLSYYPGYFDAGFYMALFISSDGALADSEFVDITVNDTPRPPVWSNIADRAVFEGETISFKVKASDPDSTIPMLSVEPIPENATFVDSLNGVGSFTFSPDYTQSGQYVLTFIASDGVLADSEIVNIFVFEAGNQPPAIDSIGPQSVVEGQHLELLITATDPEGAIPALQAFNLPANSVFADSGDGTGSFAFDPDFTQAGVYNVLFRAFDGELYDSLWVEVTVIDFGFPPVLDSIGPQTVTEGQTLLVSVSASDPDGTTPQLLAEQLPANAIFEDSLNGAGLLTFNPDYTQAGADTVLFIATDGALSDSEYVEITVIDAGNQTPVLTPIGPQTVDEGGLLQLVINASDPDSTIPTLIAENLPANAVFNDSLNGTGLFEFAPDYTQSGLHTVRFIASDGIAADTESVDITVNNINLAPVLDTISTPRTVNEGDSLLFTVTAADPDSTVPALTAEGLPPNATFFDNGDGSGDFRFDPDYFQAGPYQVLFIASDGVLADSQYVDITVIDINQAPVLDSIPTPQTVAEAESLLFTVTAADPDLVIPALTAEGLPANATFFDNGDGSGDFRFDPDYFQAGTYPVLFIASDGSLADSQYVDINVTDVNRAPVLDSIPTPQTVVEADSLLFTVTANDIDLTIPSLSAEGLPANATFLDNGDGTGDFRFLPDHFQSGLYQILFMASDGDLADSQFVDITVTEINRPPVLDSIPTPQSVPEGDSLLFTVTAADSDLTVPLLTAEGLPVNATFLDNGDGSGDFRFDPDYFQAGPYQVLFIASDGTLADSQYVDINVSNVNRVPVLDSIPTPQTLSEGDSLLFTVTASDPDTTTPVLTAEGLPPNATFVDNNDGTGDFRFLPDYMQSGNYQVLFIAGDGLDADSQFVDIFVNNVNLPPVLDSIPTPRSVDEADSLLFTVTTSDPDTTIPILTAEGLPPNATFTDNNNGTGDFRFLPDYTQAGPYQVLFISSDGDLADSQFVDIIVNNINRLPVLDSIPTPRTVNEGDSLVFTVTASDPDGFPAIVADSLPSNATFVDNGDGTGDFRFLPDYSQSGAYSILFYATDGEDADSQYVDITVIQVDLPPVLDPIGPQTVDEGDSLILDISASDFDGTIPILSALGVPANGSFVDNHDGTGRLRFLPDYFQSGVYHVTFIASDGVLADSETVEITVNDTPRPPVIQPINDRSIFEGQTVSFMVYASDPDLTIPALSALNVPINASFTDSLNGRGFFTFSPDYTQSGTYVITFIASDGVLADSEVVSIFVFDVGNLPPEIAPISPQTVVEGEHLEFIVSASDPDGTTPALQGFNLPVNATFADSGNGHGIFMFDPDYTQAGVDSVLFRAFDGQLYDSLWVQITVIDFGFPPVLDSIGPQTVVEGGTLQVAISASDPDSTTPQLLAEQLPVNAFFEDSLNGHGLLTFTPDYIQSGVDTVLFIATDGALSDSEYVEITVIEAGNQPPVLGTIGSRTVDEGDSLIFVVAATDPDSTVPVLSATGLPANATFTDNFDGTGTFEFYPDYTQAGVDTVLFIAADSTLADSEYVEITIYNVNLPPALAPIAPQSVNEGDILQLIVTATDPDGNIPSLFADSLPVNSSFVDSSNGTGLFEFAPDYTQAGVYNVLFIAYDGLLTDSQFVEITVLDVNLPPVFDPVPDQQVVEADSLFFSVHATDPEGLTPSLYVDSLLTNSVFTDNGDGTGDFEYRPDYTQSGIDTVMFIASDGVLEESLKVQITTIEAGNQPPVLDPIGSQVVDEGQQLQFNVYGSDVDGPPPALDAEGLPPNAVFIDSSNGVGTFTFNPDYLQAGTYNILFLATDGDLADSEKVEILVNNVNRPPVLSPIGTQTISEGDSLGLNLSAIDLDGDSLVITADPLVANMTFADSGNGAAFFQFMPDYTQSGIYFVVFAVTDGIDADTESVQINVNEAGNQAPVLAPVDSAYFITEGYSLDIPISAYDLDNDSLILTADSLVENMTFEDYGNGNGLFNFSPSYVQSGDYTVTFRVFDGLVYDSATTFIHVAEEGNQPPVLDPIGPQTVPEGESLVVNVSATDPEGATPFLFVTGEPDSSYFVDYGDGTGRFVYYPDFYDAGFDTVRFSAVDDGGFADYEDVIITITDVNLPPIVTFTGDTVVQQGDTTQINILVTDSSDYMPGAISLSHGYMPLNSTFMITGNGTAILTFYPDFSQIGADSALIIATDSDEPPLTDRRWIHFVITQTNRAPVFPPPNPGIVNEGGTLVMDISATDPDGDSLVMFINCDCPVPLPPRSQFEDFGDGTARFTFNPDFTQSGIYIIYFAATDGELTVTRPTFVQVVEMGNQVPTLNTIGSLSVVEGDTLDVHITSTDPDSTIGTYVLEGTTPWNLVFTDSSNNNASMHIEPLYNQSGVYNMLVIFNDIGGAADSEYVDLTIVEAGNQTPQLDTILDRQLAEGELVEILVHAVDPDSSIPSLAVNNMPANATFEDYGDGTGYFAFSPSFFQAGVYHITFLAVDSEDSTAVDSMIVTITVTDVNRPPVIDPVGPFTINEGDTLIFDVVSHDPDSTTPNLVNLLPPQNSTFIIHGDGTGTFTFMPDFFQAALDTARFLAADSTDPTLFVTLNVFITVLDVNRPPVLTPIPDTVIGDGFMLTLPVESIDPDSTVPTLFQRNMPDSATFLNFGDGTGVFQWRPRFEDIGTYNVTFGCIDQLDPSLADSQIVVIEVITSGNHPPVFIPTPHQTVGAEDTLNLMVQAIDPESDPITINYVGSLPAGMVFADSGGGIASLYWIPTMDQGGDYLVTLVATDDSLLTDTTRIGITVTTYIRGDANGDGNLNGLDVVFLVGYLKGGPAPDPIESGDANGDGSTNGLDVVYLINYFKGYGPPPPPVSPGGGGSVNRYINRAIKIR